MSQSGHTATEPDPTIRRLRDRGWWARLESRCPSPCDWARPSGRYKLLRDYGGIKMFATDCFNPQNSVRLLPFFSARRIRSEHAIAFAPPDYV
jgi:hypothetical protein